MQPSATRRLAYIPSPATRAYILRQLRENDNENYLANLLQPKRVQHAHAAIRAFNVELAHIRNSVSNEDLGRLRIAHFRSSLDELLTAHEPSPQTPIMEGLAECVTAFPEVDFRVLHTLIDAREGDLGYPSHATLASLEEFGRDTQGVLLRLHAEMLGESESTQEVADRAGMAVGLAIALRGVPAHAVSRLSYMPQEVIRSVGASQKALLGGTEDAEAMAVFQIVGERAETLVRQTDARVSSMNGSVKPAFWPLRMADLYLARLRKARWNPFDESLQRGLRTTYPLALQIRLLRHRIFG